MVIILDRGAAVSDGPNPERINLAHVGLASHDQTNNLTTPLTLGFEIQTDKQPKPRRSPGQHGHGERAQVAD